MAARSLTSAPVCERAALAPASLAPGCEQHDRRARLDRSLPRPGERPPIAKVLGVHGHDGGPRVVCEHLDQVRGGQVGLVPERREARDAEPVVGGEQGDLEREVAALRDHADRARHEVVRAEVELRSRVVDAEAVGAEHHRTRLAHAGRQRVLARLALVAELSEACADGDDRARPGRERGVDGLLEAGRGHRHDDELGALRQLFERSVRPLPEDLASLAVDEVDAASVRATQRATRDPLPPLPGVARGADDSDRAGVEERPHVAHARKPTRGA